MNRRGRYGVGGGGQHRDLVTSQGKRRRTGGRSCLLHGVGTIRVLVVNVTLFNLRVVELFFMITDLFVDLAWPISPMDFFVKQFDTCINLDKTLITLNAKNGREIQWRHIGW